MANAKVTLLAVFLAVVISVATAHVIGGLGVGFIGGGYGSGYGYGRYPGYGGYGGYGGYYRPYGYDYGYGGGYGHGYGGPAIYF